MINNGPNAEQTTTANGMASISPKQTGHNGEEVTAPIQHPRNINKYNDSQERNLFIAVLLQSHQRNSLGTAPRCHSLFLGT